MTEQIAALRQKIEALTYRVDSFGGYGDRRELEGLVKELRLIEALRPAPPAVRWPLRLVA
jgi:hypothetical protein